MRRMKPIFLAVCTLAMTTLVAGAPSDRPAADQQVTGEHRGYTNEKLFVRVADDKEMTFVVRIPGDKDEKWHKDFQVKSRITVTYHQGPDDKLPIATAIRTAN